MATNEELESRLAALEALIMTEYEPPSGPEYSFPVPGQPIDQEQFQLLSLATGNGIIDRGDYPFWLEGWGSDSETNRKNSMLLKVGQNGRQAESVVGGYYHVMTEDKEIPLPAVVKETTYHICITFDPRVLEGETDQRDSPVTVEVYDTDPPVTFNRIPTEVYSVTRKPNQLLTDAVVERKRPRVVPPIAAYSRDHLPNPKTVLYGSVAFVYGEMDILVAIGASREEGGPMRWQSLFAPEQEYTRPDGVYKWVGHGAKPGGCKIGQVVYLEGRFARGDRFDGQDFNAGTDYELMTLPVGMRPRSERRFVTKKSDYNANNVVTIRVGTDGKVIVRPAVQAAWVGLDGINYTLTR